MATIRDIENATLDRINDELGSLFVELFDASETIDPAIYEEAEYVIELQGVFNEAVKRLFPDYEIRGNALAAMYSVMLHRTRS